MSCGLIPKVVARTFTFIGEGDRPSLASLCYECAYHIVEHNPDLKARTLKVGDYTPTSHDPELAKDIIVEAINMTDMAIVPEEATWN